MATETPTASYPVNVRETIAILEAYIPARLPVMLWGGPGVGKSAAAKHFIKHDYHFHDIRGLLMEPPDLQGLPTFWTDEAGRQRSAHALPTFLPPSDSPEKHLFVLEEITSAMPTMQAALYQLVFDHRIGEYRLPDGASIIACGNRVNDRGVAYAMPTPLASRFAVHLDVEPDTAEWIDWALTVGIETEVLFWMDYKPESLYHFEPERIGKDNNHTFPCPRTWEFVSDYLRARRGKGIDEDLEVKILVGMLGEMYGLEFAAFLRMWRELPHPQAAIADPDGCRLPDKPDARIAMCGALFNYLDQESFGAIVKIATRIEPEIGQYLVNLCIKKDDDLQYSKAYIEGWVSKNRV